MQHQIDLPKPYPSLILLVEVDRALRLHDANELLDEGYEVVESESLSEAMHILEGRGDFDALVVDISPQRAPGGLALVRYAARHSTGIKILVSSDWDDAAAEAVALSAKCLIRPYPDGALARMLRQLLAVPVRPLEPDSP